MRIGKRMITMIIALAMIFTMIPGMTLVSHAMEHRTFPSDLKVEFTADAMKITTSDSVFLNMLLHTGSDNVRVFYGSKSAEELEGVWPSNSVIGFGARTHDGTISGNTLTAPYPNKYDRPIIGDNTIIFYEIKDYGSDIYYDDGLLHVKSSYGRKPLPDVTFNCDGEGNLIISSSDTNYISEVGSIWMWDQPDWDGYSYQGDQNWQYHYADKTDKKITVDLLSNGNAPTNGTHNIVIYSSNGEYINYFGNVNIDNGLFDMEYNYYSSDVHLVLKATDERAVPVTNMVGLSYFAEDSTGKGYVEEEVEEKFLYKDGDLLTVPANWFYEYGTPSSQDGLPMYFSVWMRVKDNNLHSADKDVKLPYVSGITNPVTITGTQNDAKDFVIKSSDADYIKNVNRIELVTPEGNYGPWAQTLYDVEDERNSVKFENGNIVVDGGELYRTCKHMLNNDLSKTSKLYLRVFSKSNVYSIIPLGDLDFTVDLSKSAEVSVDADGNLVIKMSPVAAQYYPGVEITYNGKYVPYSTNFISEGHRVLPYEELVYLAGQGKFPKGSATLDVKIYMYRETEGITGEYNKKVTINTKGEAGCIHYLRYEQDMNDYIGALSEQYFMAPSKGVTLKAVPDYWGKASWHLVDAKGIASKTAATKLPDGLTGDVTVYGDFGLYPLPDSAYGIAKKVGSVKLSATTYSYSGTAKKPSVTVKDSEGNKLVKGTDYTVSYASGRKAVGKYLVTVKGKGDFSFTKKLYFKINPKTPVISALTPGSKKLTVKMKTKVASTGGSTYKIAYKVSGTKTWKNTSTTAQSKVIKSLKKGKKYDVRVRATKKVGTTTYMSAWTKTKTSKAVK